jgi:AraC-like DNA-binding protein
MLTRTEEPEGPLSLFVKNIVIIEEPDASEETVMSFYADGYPGMLFHETTDGLTAMPHDKKMPPLSIYGQTLGPVQLVTGGRFRLIVLRLYPFVLKSLFGIAPATINDDCYDLSSFPGSANLLAGLLSANETKIRTALMSDFLLGLAGKGGAGIDKEIARAVEAIISSAGQSVIPEIRRQAGLSERTFERRFLRETGLTPKQFSKIIQFQESLSQLEGSEYEKLTDIVYSNGYADQSHFIRVFRSFTGVTPREFGR